ncbi:MAG: sodium-dependent transporter [Puniceicoccaceae bacterium]
MSSRKQEAWSSRLGIILAVAGSAVGLGNFLRFPGQVAEFGGGAFMIAYFLAFVLIGLPVCWVEWTMGRAGGRFGFNSAPGIFAAVTKMTGARFPGVLAFVIPVCIYMYYAVIEAWCLAYAVNYIRDGLEFEAPAEAEKFFGSLVGSGADGSAMRLDLAHVGVYFVVVFVLNFILIYRGIAKGIEWFCKFAMPVLVLLALIILVRVLTLGTPDADHPDRNIDTGLGFMWNPEKTYLVERQLGEDGAPMVSPEGQPLWNMEEKREVVAEANIRAAAELAAADPESYRLVERSLARQLLNPDLWLAAAGQIFFTHSVGFGVIITYASYLRRRDDVVLSSLAATSANEFCEVGIGGLISIPAAVAFFGVTGLAAMGLGTFGVGFIALPMVFSEMPLGHIFGFGFFLLLFLAAVTSSISMLQPGIAYLEDSLKINRRQSVSILGFITGIGGLLVIFFSFENKLLDTIDFWVTNLLMVVLALMQVFLFGWVIGTRRGLAEAEKGSAIRIPRVFGFIIKFVTPVFLIAILAGWIYKSVLGHTFGSDEPEISGKIIDLFYEPDPVAWIGILLIALLFLLGLLNLPGKQEIRTNINKAEQKGDGL